jgi:hypothetical protein
MRRICRTLLAAGALLSLTTLATKSDAAERWVDRPMTLHRLVFAGDAGLGVGHRRFNGPFDSTGAGLNLEGALGVTERLELGFRTGIRFGNDGRARGADYYGRTLSTETYGTGLHGNGADTVANPELRIRWVAYSGSVAEVGLDGRVFLPIEDGSRFGMMFGVPLAFHVSDILRIDTGVYIPVIFNDRTFNGLSIPGYFWFQATEKLWLGPMAQLRFIDPGLGDHDAHLLLGFGLGYQVASSVDLKTMLLFPAVDDGVTRSVGAGFGVQFRIGE